MITLDNISLETLRISWYEETLYNRLCKQKARSVQDVINYKDTLKDDDILSDADYLKRINSEIKKIKSKVERLNEKGMQLDIYETNRDYPNTDRMNTGNILLLKNPTEDCSVRTYTLEYKSIDKIKNDLGLINENGQNYLIYSYNKIGRTYLKNILKALEMYDEQVLKQSKETDDTNNIFMHNHDEKATIVSYNYDDIINYFVDNNKDLIWGKMTDNQKKAYLSSITRKTQSNRRIRKRIINYISNYTTLDELNNLKEDDYKVLEKFMK